MKENRFRMEQKEQTEEGGMRKAFRVLTVIAVVYGAIQLVASLIMQYGKQLEMGNRDRSAKRYLSFMNGYSRKLKGEKVDSIKVTSIMGGVELDLTGAELAAHTQLDVCCVMSGVIIKVPPMVEVTDSAKSIMSGVANMVPRYHKEGLPVIHLTAKCVMAGVSIKVICESEEDTE